MRVGEVIGGRFVVERRSARGGMGAIWRAHDEHTGELVALKTIYGGTERDLERFAREAQILSELSHPGLVKYVAHGITENGTAFLAMEWLHGEPLGVRLARGALPIDESITFARRAAEALAVAHARGVVHRDVKPDNLFLVDGRLDRVKVIDFGIARFGRSKTVTGSDVMIGTPRYMAPEQARGGKYLDPRCDVFSLGCVVFECVCGRRAFTGDDVVAVLAKVLLDEAPRVRELRPEAPPALDELIARMLAKAPAERPAHAGVVASALAALDASAEEPTPPPAPQKRRAGLLGRGEQRFVSVVLSGAPERDDEAATITDDEWRKTSELAQRGRAAATELGARVETLADGSLVATLVGQGNPTDQAARAARCALGIRASLPGVPLVLASGRGVMDGRLPFGAVIDEAVALLNAEVAREGARDPRTGVRLDQATAGLLDVRFAVVGDAHGMVLRAEREIVEAPRTLLGQPTPCVGRERELLTLEATFAECQAEPVARALIVTAGPGVGKSRLRSELLRTVRARYEDAEVWMARGDPIARGSSFGMIARALRREVGLLQGEPADTGRQRVRARVSRNLAGLDAQRVAEFLGELAGVPFPDEGRVQLRAARKDPRLMGDQIRRAWRDFLAAECAAQPVLLVLEDLHWGDLPSVRLVDAALAELADKPFMVLALARPEVDDLFPRLWQDRGVQRIALAELTRRASEKLARRVLGDAVDDAVITRVAERAGGNAFWLEELIRSVAEGRAEELPATVLAMVQARIERCDPETRRVLRAASVFGEVFWRGGVAALVGDLDAKQLGARLAQLVEQELVTTRGEGKFPGQDELAFRHALVRDAAFEMLTPGDAELGHRLAGAWLERAGETEAVVLAEHFERGGEPRRAIAWYARAAAQALEGNDFDAAFARAERGVHCGAAETDLGELRLLQAQAHEWRGRHADAKTCAVAAMRWLAAGSAPWMTAAAELAISSGRLADFATLTELAEALLESPEGAPADGEYVIALSRAASQLLLAGRRELAERVLARMERLALAFDDAHLTVVGQIEMVRALGAHFDGDGGVARRLSARAADCFERAGDLRMACTQRLNMGYASIELGAYAQAEGELRDAMSTAERLGLPPVLTAARHNLGLAVARLGRAAEGAELEALAVEGARAQGDPRMEGGSRIYLAQILLMRGDASGAAREARTAVKVCAGSLPAKCKALATLAQTQLAARRLDDALTSAREAMDILDRLGGVDGEEEVIRLAYAEALHATGDTTGAKKAIELARDRLHERAAKLSERALRESFLANVPACARTLRLAGEWLATR